MWCSLTPPISLALKCKETYDIMIVFLCNNTMHESFWWFATSPEIFVSPGL